MLGDFFAASTLETLQLFHTASGLSGDHDRPASKSVKELTGLGERERERELYSNLDFESRTNRDRLDSRL